MIAFCPFPSLAPRVSSTPFDVALMNQTLRINNDDPRVTYNGEWAQGDQYSFTTVTSTIGGVFSFFLMFRGVIHT